MSRSAKSTLCATLAIALMGVASCTTTSMSGTGGRASSIPTLDSSIPTSESTDPTDQTAQTAQTSADEQSGESETESSRENGQPLSSAPVPSAPGTADISAVSCPAGTVSVNSADALTKALAAAQPGDVIVLADGTYSGNFVAEVSGTAQAPIWLCGGRGAVIDGGSTDDGYAFHVQGASYWRLVGFTIRGAQKGIIVDSGARIIIQGLSVSDVGDEAIHLRGGTTFSVVRDNDVATTGLRKEKFGEGIYIGSASSNWCKYSACGPDRSNNNAIVDNRIRATSAESIDIKEGTQDGLIQGNTFDGAGGLTGADSWVDVKGNGWRIVGNSGTNSPVDGFQVHSVVDGWGVGNVFEGNTAVVNGSGYGIHLAPIQDNTVSCDNRATGAAGGLTNTTCG